MSDNSDGTIKNLGIFGTLQAATDQKQFLLCASFALLIDNVLAFFQQPTLMDMATDKSALASSNLTIQVVLIFVAYSFLISLVLPIAAMIHYQIYLLTLDGWVSRIERYWDKELHRAQDKALPNKDYVRPWDLRTEAHLTMEKYYLDLYKNYEQEWESAEDSRFRFAYYAFSCMVMLGINFYWGDEFHRTASFAIARFFESNAPIWCALCSLFVMSVWRLYQPADAGWVYCPNLYMKIYGTDERSYTIRTVTHQSDSNDDQ